MSKTGLMAFQNVLIFILTVFIHIGCQQNCSAVQAQAVNINIDSIEYEAFNKELLVDIKGDTIAGYAFIASGEALKETVLLLSGYPGNDNNFDIAQEIRKSGKNVIHFNHRGAWGSQGIFSYSNCLEDVEMLINYLSEDTISKSLRIKKDNFVLLGRSYGGGIGLIQGSNNFSVKKIIAISSVNYGDIMEGYQTLDELGNFKKYMKKQIMMKHDIDLFLQELLDNKEEYNILKYLNPLGEKDVLIIENNKKNEDWILQIKNATYINIESDHNFVDKRSELEKTIVDWLNKD